MGLFALRNYYTVTCAARFQAYKEFAILNSEMEQRSVLKKSTGSPGDKDDAQLGAYRTKLCASETQVQALDIHHNQSTSELLFPGSFPQPSSTHKATVNIPVFQKQYHWLTLVFRIQTGNSIPKHLLVKLPSLFLHLKD